LIRGISTAVFAYSNAVPDPPTCLSDPPAAGLQNLTSQISPHVNPSKFARPYRGSGKPEPNCRAWPFIHVNCGLPTDDLLYALHEYESCATLYHAMSDIQLLEAITVSIPIRPADGGMEERYPATAAPNRQPSTPIGCASGEGEIVADRETCRLRLHSIYRLRCRHVRLLSLAGGVFHVDLSTAFSHRELGCLLAGMGVRQLRRQFALPGSLHTGDSR
jgi:hypothetical protein